MKKQILISLILLTVFNVISVFGQEKNDFVSETIKFNTLKISANKKEVFLSAFLKPLLSKNGSIEFDQQTQTLLLKDTQSRVDFTKKLTIILDNSGLQAKDFVKLGEDKKRVTETVFPQIMVYRIGCDVGEEFVYDESSLKQPLLIKIMEAVKVQFKIVARAAPAYGLELVGNRKRVELAKKIITLFDEANLDRISNI